MYGIYTWLLSVLNWSFYGYGMSSKIVSWETVIASKCSYYHCCLLLMSEFQTIKIQRVTKLSRLCQFGFHILPYAKVTLFFFSFLTGDCCWSLFTMIMVMVMNCLMICLEKNRDKIIMISDCKNRKRLTFEKNRKKITYCITKTQMNHLRKVLIITKKLNGILSHVHGLLVSTNKLVAHKKVSLTRLY